MKVLMTILAVGMPLVSSAQLRTPQLPREDLTTTSKQADEVFDVLGEVTRKSGDIVFPIFSHRSHIAYGISIGGDQLIAKASEVAIYSRLITANKKKEGVPMTVVGAYPDHDLVVLKAPGLGAPAATWVDSSKLEEGSFLAAVGSDGRAKAMGVLSVHERSLREADQGQLGVMLDPEKIGEGAVVHYVLEGSAAHEAGIRAGDVLLKINDVNVKGHYEVLTKLRRMKVGEKPEIMILRDGKPQLVFPTLKALPPVRKNESSRMRMMDGELNRVRGNFGNVLQSDMELNVRDTGLPITDLNGNIVGMVIARAGRISTLIIPGEEMKELLSQKPQVIDMRPSRISGRASRSQESERQRQIRQLQNRLNRR